MATDTDGPTGPLSEFGETRVSEAARERAERIDAQTATWRFYTEVVLQLVVLAEVVAIVLGLGGVVLYHRPLFALETIAAIATATWRPVLVATVAGYLSNYVANPEPEELV
ncbi:hypothetical protein Htur_5053 (plasmid) [Haloterrigena turkmenica DSM 5511]|uniref:Uncharacterized protein n=1 Tax=Haloterrigena turkmenica (strain ATCC 51198 / DSM 5511 / JCM 9101 / NCIMB 13204 / VKM B-1734 / 4k) TaxID=543526 RepID=D2S3J3_HALTV|nr:hypothetical protein [Haloterrigena turkmenica]ADB63940.1 hypothetical protein Htur_5053 [Haloterrigena turkmenica DSM 5511]